MNGDNLKISENIGDGICRFIVSGRIDSNSADDLQDKLENALKTGQKTIILNMSEVEYLSSIGIRVILKIFKEASENGGIFNIERPSDIVKSVLGMVALKELLVT